MATGADQKNLTCTVCLDYFKEPKVLPCCHTFCKSCLDRLVEESKEKGKITCPQCRSEHAVPENGPSGFLTDYVCDQDLELVKTKDPKEKALTCGECESIEPAVAYCNDCHSYLCEDCRSTVHKKYRLLRNHKVILIEGLTRETFNSYFPQHCVQHTDEVLKLYCNTCQQLVCRDCCLFDHKDHQFKLLKDARQETTSELNDLTDQVKAKLDEWGKNLEIAKKAEKIMQCRPDELKSSINTSFDAILSAIESRRAELLAEAESECQKDMKQVWSEKDSLELTSICMSATLSFAERALQCCSDAEMLLLSKQAVQRLNELKDRQWSPDELVSMLRSAVKFEQKTKVDATRIGRIIRDETPNTDTQVSVTGLSAEAALGQTLQFHISQQTFIQELGLPLPGGSTEPKVNITYGLNIKSPQKFQVNKVGSSWTVERCNTICGVIVVLISTWPTR